MLHLDELYMNQYIQFDEKGYSVDKGNLNIAKWAFNSNLVFSCNQNAFFSSVKRNWLTPSCPRFLRIPSSLQNCFLILNVMLYFQAKPLRYHFVGLCIFLRFGVYPCFGYYFLRENFIVFSGHISQQQYLCLKQTYKCTYLIKYKKPTITKISTSQ